MPPPPSPEASSSSTAAARKAIPKPPRTPADIPAGPSYINRAPPESAEKFTAPTGPRRPKAPAGNARLAGKPGTGANTGASAGLLRRRGMVLAASAIVVTAAGAFAGAMLKTETQKRTEAERWKEEALESRIERIRTYRAGLERQRATLLDKMRALEERQKSAGGGSGKGWW